MYDLITYQSYALIEGLIEFHHLCYGCNETDYLTECIDCILSVFQNIVINRITDFIALWNRRVN